MPWQIPVFLRVVVSYFLHPYFVKKVADAPSRARSLVVQYVCTALCAGCAGLIGGADWGDVRIFVVMVIGAFNAFACYCHWRATAMSLSKTSLFTQADDLITLALGYLILGEGKVVGFALGVGVLLAVGSALLFAYEKGHKSAGSGTREATSHAWGIGVWIGLYSVIWGVAVFSMRYLSLEGMTLLAYVFAWYAGSVVGALAVRLFASKEEVGQPLTRRQVFIAARPALTAWTALMLSYWSMQLAPIIVVQPIMQVSEMIFPMIIGLWIFKEIHGLTRRGKCAITMGLVGGIIISLSY